MTQKVKKAKRNLNKELEEEKPEESETDRATSDEDQNSPTHVAKTVRLKAKGKTVLKSRKATIKKAKILQNVQSKRMYA